MSSSVELQKVNVDVPPSYKESKDGDETGRLVSNERKTPTPPPTASASVAQEKYYTYLRALRAAWADAPEVNVSYSQVSYQMDIAMNDTEVPSILKSVRNIGRMFTLRKRATYKLQGLSNVSGIVRPGEMTLILAPPGHGKSLLLKALSSRVRTKQFLTGSVLYNGLTAEELQEKTGLRANKLTAYIGQQDLHMSLLTVRETFQAALAHSVADVSLLNDAEVQRQHAEKVELLIDVLGLRECAETIVGNDLVRGCSGGQKKRVTIGEQLIGNARVLFLDEITTGLDAAVAFDILNVLKNWCKIMGGSVVGALLQPTPEIYALFSQVVLLREGECVYTGPREEVGPYLHNLGIKCPNDQDEADFIVDFLTDPALYAAKFRQRELRFVRRQLSEKHRGGGSQTHTKHFFDNSKLQMERQTSQSVSERPIVTFHVGANTERVELSPDEEKVMKEAEDSARKMVEQIEKHQPDRNSANIPLSTTALVEAFQKSVQWKKLRAELDDLHAKDRVKALADGITSKKSTYTKEQFENEFSHSIFRHLAINIRRQAIYVGRNKLMIFPRLFSALFMGMCIGTLYINLPTSNFIGRIGLILFACVFLAFSNLAELPVSEELKKAVGKHMDSSWYPAWIQIFATIVLSLPIAVFEVIFFSLLVYFVPHFDYDGGRYFFALLILFMCNLVLGAIFRSVSYLVPTQVIAQQLGGPIIVMFMAFGGFLITESNIPDYLIEFFWLSPFAWAMRALANNEFNDGRYSAPVDANGQRLGDYDMSLYQIRTDNVWKWTAFAYLVGIFLFFSMLTSLALKYMRYDDSIGTKRPPEEEAIRSKMSLEAVEVAIEQELALHSQVHIGSPMSRLPSEKKLPTNSSTVLPFVPTTMTWRDVVYSIPVDGRERVLLNGVSGYARPGVLTALMGASGAGKTTLIDVLAGRKTQGSLAGDILVNGTPFREVNFRRVLGYVEQNDLHFPLDTVRGALLFSANLRLPGEVTQKQREAFVDELIELLELKPIADRVVGSDYVAGLAGWQRKLVTIGVELASNPAILCLDEPTSGLDSRAALVVMRVIRKIASTGRSVICTIHQPSQEVFLMFDRLLLLRSGGETVYFGPLGAGDADALVEYFETATPETPIAPMPEKMNPASWMLEVIGAGTVKNNDVDYAQVFKKHHLHQQLEVDFKDIDKDLETTKVALEKKSGKAVEVGTDEYASSIVRQFYYVQKRAFSSYWRNVPLNLTRFLLVMGIGLLFGLLYRNTRDVGTELANLQSKIASVFMTIGFSSALQTIIVVPVLMFDRPAYYREKFSMTYASSVYSLSTFIVDLPYVFFAAVLFNCSFYFMTHLPYDGAIFFKYILAAFLNQMTFISVGHLMAAATPNFVVATQLLGICFTFFFLFGGTFISPASIPNGWIWMYWIDSLPKAVMACLGEIFQCDGGSDVCPSINAPGPTAGSTIPITYNDWVEQSYNTATGQYGKWIGYLILTIAVYRILIALSLAKISHIKR